VLSAVGCGCGGGSTLQDCGGEDRGGGEGGRTGIGVVELLLESECEDLEHPGLFRGTQGQAGRRRSESETMLKSPEREISRKRVPECSWVGCEVRYKSA
jgi:hypothetical protein